MRVPRRATVLPGGATLTGRGLPEPAVRPPGRYRYEVKAGVVGVGLVAAVAEDVDGGVLDRAVPACLTSDEAYATPLATAVEIIAPPTPSADRGDAPTLLLVRCVDRYGQPCFTLAGAVFQLLGMKVMT
ncbi:hypothetical protein ACWGQT_34460 [Streptomyces yangpuensis]